MGSPKTLPATPLGHAAPTEGRSALGLDLPRNDCRACAGAKSRGEVPLVIPSAA